MFKPKVTLTKDTFERIKLAAEVVGASSVEEFVEKTLLSEADRILREAGKGNISDAEVDDIANKLKGLGYIE